MIYIDQLRPPPPFDPLAPRYKDWLHLNLLDHASGIVGLVNTSIHGAPENPCSRAVGAAMAYVPGRGWVGDLEVRALREAAIGRAGIGLERSALALEPRSGALLASVQDPQNGLSARLTATAASSPIVVEDPLPFGQSHPQNWICWRAVPRMKVDGEWTIEGERLDLRAASAYHDHNWGRWRWGDDLGWEWGCFLQQSPGAAIVLSCTTDRTHRNRGLPSLSVHLGLQRRSFPGPAIEISYSGEFEKISRRVPGALAALHQDRAWLRLPRRLRITAGDGLDRITLDFNGHAAAQLIMADPIVRGYGFIHEIAGEFSCAGVLGDQAISGTGLGVFEYVC